MSNFEALRQSALFRGLSLQEIAALRRIMHSRTFSSNTIILEKGQEGDGVYILASGTTKICIRRDDGNEVILNILGPGQVLGELSAVDNAGHSASVITLETCRFLWMEETDFTACRHSMPSLNHNLVLILTQRLRRLTRQMEAVTTLDVYGRIACQLLAFAQDYGQVASNGDILLPLHLTQLDLAGLIGASRGRVNQVMAFYKRQRYLSVGPDCRITIHDQAALAKRCQVLPTPGERAIPGSG